MTPVAVILVALASCSAVTDRSLVGLWESVARSRGGIGHTLEFKPDGSAVAAITVIVDQIYRVDAGKLLMADDEAALKSETDGPKVEVQGTAFTLTSSNGEALVKERVGAVEDARRPIVGVWRYRHLTGRMAFERFTANGWMLFRLPLKTQPGCYTLASGTLTVTSAEVATTATFKSKLTGDELELRTEGQEPNLYKRAPGAWYPRETIDVNPVAPPK